MKKNASNLRTALLGILALAVFGLQSCSNDAEQAAIPEEAQLSQTELQTIMETEEWTGAVDDVLTELFQNQTAASGKFADDSCYQASYSETGFTVVFGNCVLNQTENVNGTLEVVYNTDVSAASFTATYKGFFVGQAELNGSRTFTLTESGETGFDFSVQSDMTVRLGDGRTIQESGTRTLSFQFGETLADIRFSITGSWELSVDDTVYLVTVSSPVTGNLGCGYLVSGVMDISKNGLQVSVDFGDGSCDNAVTVIYPNGATEELEL
ncbi:MAG: hypothetical protein R3252_05485 [Robiginitalea sp.]|nr:hypothetical protein [Robiginitalea sp.]